MSGTYGIERECDGLADVPDFQSENRGVGCQPGHVKVGSLRFRLERSERMNGKLTKQGDLVILSERS
jgi:hypothetical protein